MQLQPHEVGTQQAEHYQTVKAPKRVSYKRYHQGNRPSTTDKYSKGGKPVSQATNKVEYLNSAATRGAETNYPTHFQMSSDAGKPSSVQQRVSQFHVEAQTPQKYVKNYR